MTEIVFLDAGPLGAITNPNQTPLVRSMQSWTVRLMAAGVKIVVPAVADFEVRREVIRANSARSLASLDAFDGSPSDRYLPLTDSALKLAASLWAQARNVRTLPADPKELNCDVLIAAQALDYAGTHGIVESEIVVATTNVGHLVQFVRAELWTSITSK